jgi:hypothetical protein
MLDHYFLAGDGPKELIDREFVRTRNDRARSLVWDVLAFVGGIGLFVLSYLSR